MIAPLVGCDLDHAATTGATAIPIRHLPLAVVLDLESTYEIDTTGTDALLQVKQTLDDRGIRSLVANSRP